jgi:starvation-inducible DNA-binding protein
MTTTITSPLENTRDRQVTGEALQGALVDLIDLSLLAKQAHWTLIGPRFRSIHLQLDEVVTLAREQMDLVAERAAAIGVHPDGRARAIVQGSGLPDFKANTWLKDSDVVESFVEIFHVLIARMRERVQETEKPDPVTQDLLLTTTAELEKQYWMFQAES